jgi:16S rRNA (cytidine1402-2'-O)-methyltransferase
MFNAHLKLAVDAALAATADQAWPCALYIVATPIGNLADFSLRGIAALARAELIACEDTRVAAKLLQAYGIEPKKLLRADAHAEHEAKAAVLAALGEGKRVAYVSDAGTPAVSDPGALLAQAAHTAGFRVLPLPGASAVMSLLQAAGQVHTAFRFLGFAPTKDKALDEFLGKLQSAAEISVFFESPQRIERCLERIAALIDPRREITLGRELTKRFEVITKLRIGELTAHLQSQPQLQGEWVIALGPALDTGSAATEADHQALLSKLLPHMPVKAAVALAAELTGAPRNALYALALRLKGEQEFEANDE